jgi:hypothetical protein
MLSAEIFSGGNIVHGANLIKKKKAIRRLRAKKKARLSPSPARHPQIFLLRLNYIVLGGRIAWLLSAWRFTWAELSELCFTRRVCNFFPLCVSFTRLCRRTVLRRLLEVLRRLLSLPLCLTTLVVLSDLVALRWRMRVLVFAAASTGIISPAAPITTPRIHFDFNMPTPFSEIQRPSVHARDSYSLSDGTGGET